MGAIIADKSVRTALIGSVVFTCLLIISLEFNFWGSFSKSMDDKFEVASEQVNADWRIVLKNSFSESEIIFSGTNVNPDSYENKIVWEGQYAGTWQIFYFDGVKVKMLTNSALPNLFPIINENYISWIKKISDTEWQIELLNLSDESISTVGKIDKAWPIEFETEKKIKVKSENSEYPAIEIN